VQEITLACVTVKMNHNSSPDLNASFLDYDPAPVPIPDELIFASTPETSSSNSHAHAEATMTANSEPDDLDYSSLDWESLSILTASALISTSSAFENTASGDNNGSAEAASHPAQFDGDPEMENAEAASHPAQFDCNPEMENAGAQLTRKAKVIQVYLSVMLHAYNCQLRDDLVGKSGTKAEPVRFIYCLCFQVKFYHVLKT